LPPKPDKETEAALSDYLRTDHAKIAERARPLLDKMKTALTPYSEVSTDRIHYEYIQDKANRLLGQCVYVPDGSIRIRIHPALKINPEHFDETLTHELAHALAYRWKGRGGHGHSYYWGYFMIAMGLEPDRVASEEKGRTFRKGKEVRNLPRFKFFICINHNCKSHKQEVMAELIDFEYHCPDCNHTTLRPID